MAVSRWNSLHQTMSWCINKPVSRWPADTDKWKIECSQMEKVVDIAAMDTRLDNHRLMCLRVACTRVYLYMNMWIPGSGIHARCKNTFQTWRIEFACSELIHATLYIIPLTIPWDSSHTYIRLHCMHAVQCIVPCVSMRCIHACNSHPQCLAVCTSCTDV